jgi:N-carbamoylputrescine amidase
MSRLTKIAVTETRNAFLEMPGRTEDLGALEGRLEDIRRANVAHHAELIRAAAGLGVRAIGLGEMFTGPYFAVTRHPIWLGLAEDAESGPTLRELSELAKRHGIMISAPIYERDGKSGKRYNTAVLIDSDGTRLGKYRKTHIPEGENEQNAFNEPFYFGPSDEPLDNPRSIASNRFFPVFESAVGLRVGVAICYDRHFDGVMRSLASGGAELIFSPAVTFGAKSERMWELEFQVDAARHNVFIAGSNRLRAEPPWNQQYFGKSYVCGPSGKIAAEPSPAGLVVATIDLDALSDADPSGWKLRRDRRPEIYER